MEGGALYAVCMVLRSVAALCLLLALAGCGRVTSPANTSSVKDMCIQQGGTWSGDDWPGTCSLNKYSPYNLNP